MHRNSLFLFLAAALIAPAAAQDASSNAVPLETLALGSMTTGWASPRAARSVDGKPLTLKGVVYPRGVGTHANSRLRVALDGNAARFTATVGVDDEVGAKGSVAFEVYRDGRLATRTRILRGGDAPQPLDVDLHGAKTMDLVVTDAGDDIGYDHADWADAAIHPAAGRPAAFQATAVANAPPPPLAFGDGPAPAIHGPRVTGATPGRPFLFRIPATGEPPLKFAAANLPDGLALDAATGIITGALRTAGSTDVVVTVSGPKGKARRTLAIAAGDQLLARTPPMGWNSWNVWGTSVDDAKVRAAADAMVESGLAAHGFQYINIDDAWEAGRDANGNILTNDKFPDMKALADYVHSKGLKLGIYSSPGPTTCGGYTGSWQHEERDAKTYAAWGIDYLKYDWCSYGDIATGEGQDRLTRPYHTMRNALDATQRDIVYSLCQYGMGDVWTWGADVGGNLWRTTGDITDTWSSMSQIGFSQDAPSAHARPGHWNDPDMLVVGELGWGPTIHPTRLTPNEQITHISLWSLLAAPLLIGCDMTRLDDFTLSLLTNDEILAVDQDPLGKAARRAAARGQTEVWARPLWDGTTAVGLFNRGDDPAQVTARWSDLGLAGRQPVRNLWLRKAEGFFADAFTAEVPAHGAMLLKVGSPKRQ
jgi:alpha-galactosidase